MLCAFTSSAASQGALIATCSSLFGTRTTLWLSATIKVEVAASRANELRRYAADVEERRLRGVQPQHTSG